MAALHSVYDQVTCGQTAKRLGSILNATLVLEYETTFMNVEGTYQRVVGKRFCGWFYFIGSCPYFEARWEHHSLASTDGL